MSILGTFGSIGGGAANLTPLNYANLLTFIDLENGVTTSSGDITEIVGQAPSDFTYTVPSGHIGPEFEASSQNGLPGMSHEDDVATGSDRLRRKLSSNDSGLDDIWFGSGTQSIAFAGRWDATADGLGFNLNSIIASKGSFFNRGWNLEIQSNGTIRFRHWMTNGSTFQIAANAFYSVDDLVLGYLTYDGGNASNSASFRLYNQTSFVTTGTVTTATSSTKSSDASDELVIGNHLDPNNSDINSPFQGSLFGLWITDPANNSIDESYFSRWIP